MKTFCCIYLPGTNTGSPKDRNDYKRSDGWLYGAQRRVVRTYCPQIALKSTADIIAIPSVNPAIDSEDRYWSRRGSCYLLRRKPASELILYVGNCVRCILFAHIDATFHLQAFVRISPYRLHGCGSGIPLFVYLIHPQQHCGGYHKRFLDRQSLSFVGSPGSPLGAM